MTDTVLDTASTNAVVFDGGTFGTIDAVPESGSFDTLLDHDWLAVSLIAGHDYVFYAYGISGNLNDVALDLRDSNRTILDSQGMVDPGANITPMFTYTATSSGTEYLDISAGGNDPASQTGQYFVTYADAGTDTILDTASTNASLTIGATAAGSINAVPESGSFTTSLDHDWFAVNLIAGHVYTFSAQATFSALDNLNDVAIDLRDSSRTILDSQGVVDAGENATSTFTYIATSSGTEYLDIAAGGNNPASLTGNYQITAADSGFASPNGNYWINAYDTANTASWAWSTSAYDANGDLTSQTGMNDDGTHWLTMYDVDNRYSFSNATITFDADWNWTSVSGTNDDGSHSVTANTIAAAYDTLLWFETPYDPNSSSTAPLVLTGGSGNDVLAGNAGNDTLTGGPGNDILYGQDHYGLGGSNTFVFGPGFGQDKIMDFQTGQDTLQFSLSLLTNYAAAMADAKQVGVNTVIAVDSNDSVTLQNVNMNSLAAGNFNFS
jgi:RTX calcium-binding nonapeptide repeat (4 copies)